MKTLSLEETIQWMEKCIFEGTDWNEDFWSNYTDALNYLKNYRNNLPQYESLKIFWAKRMCDLNLPLKWDELCRLEMIGEPVWNGGTRRWMLLIDSGSDNTWIELVNNAGGRERWSEHDLRLAPLYRKPKEK